ncbi:hypothetical protein CLF_104949 [Clonorchis sinensis]|uniref:Uncharacterized protein n=1 Tax=Clonorchis sinensis TaxID=79923 RepID=G7YCN3_CLOSI|nr:hypothetical protein CLF_104949 [Clonorchis sinensis]
MRKLKISKKRIESKRKASASLRLETKQGYSSKDELQSGGTATKQEAGALKDAFIRVNVSLQTFISTVALLKIEPGKFDGNPRKFRKFMGSFRVKVASTLAGDTRRLMYLIHYCTGKAKAAIGDCVLLPGSDGSVKAMDILHKKFGRPHDIAQSFIDSMLVGGSIAAEDTDVRRKLAPKNVYGQPAGGANRVSSRGMDDIFRRSKLPRPHVNAVASKALSYPMCTAHHSLCDCVAFQAKSPEEKLQASRDLRLCFKCLKPEQTHAEPQITATCQDVVIAIIGYCTWTATRSYPLRPLLI